MGCGIGWFGPSVCCDSGVCGGIFVDASSIVGCGSWACVVFSVVVVCEGWDCVSS